MLANKRQAVFISGKGSNLKALLDSYPDVNFYIFANKNCKGMIWAKRRGFYTEVVLLANPSDWNEFSKKINSLGISRIFLLGFLKIIPESFLENTFAKCINLHPSVLPQFPGLKSIERSFEVKKGMGCTIHKVTAKVDEGDVILQKAIGSEFLKLNFKEAKERIHQFEQRLIGKYFSMTRGAYE